MSEILKWAIIFFVAVIVEMFLLAGYLDILDKREMKSKKGGIMGMPDLDKPFKVYAKGRGKYKDMAASFNEIENMDKCYKQWTQDPEYVKQFSNVFTIVRPLPIGDKWICPRCHKPLGDCATFCKCGQEIEFERGV